MSNDTLGDRGSIAAGLLSLRSGLSRSWRSALVLAALFGVTGGIAIAALSMADRVESSYDKLLTEVDAPDLVLFCAGCEDSADVDEFIQGLKADPAVAEATVVHEHYPIMYTADGVLLGPFEGECGAGPGELSAWSASWQGSEPTPLRLTGGRLPASGAANEIALPAITADRAGVEIGDELFVTGVCHEDAPTFQPRTLSVVGTFVGILDIRPPGQAEYFELTLVDSAFGDSIGVEPSVGVTLVWYSAGADVDDLTSETRSSIFLEFEDHAQLIKERLRPDATALRILAALGAVAGIAVLGQLLARHLRSLAAEHTTLRAIGMTRRGLWSLGIGHGAMIAVVAGAISAGVAAVVFPGIPPGAAEGILVGTSNSISLVALALSVAATVAAVLLLSLTPAWLAARALVQRGAVGRLSFASRLVADGRLGTTPAWGVRLALEPVASAQPVPVRSGLGAAAIATAVVAGVITFAASLDHLRTTPRLVGWNWDFVVGGDDVDLDALAEFFAAHPDVERSSFGTASPSNSTIRTGPASEEVVYDYAFGTGTNAIAPVVVAGRAPEGAAELLLNAALAEELDVEIGDGVTLLAPDSFAFLHDLLGIDRELPDLREVEFELVGIGVLPVYGGQFDIGISMTLDGQQRAFAPAPRDDMIALLISAEPNHLVPALLEMGLDELAFEIAGAAPDATATVIQSWTDEQLAPLNASFGAHAVYVDLVDDVDRAALVADFMESGLLGEDTVVIGIQPDGSAGRITDLVALDLDDVTWIPAMMGTLMALTTVAVLAHLIATGARARRRDIATLRALGMIGVQSRAIIAWQATVLVVLTAAVAFPIGVVAGRYAWSKYAEGLGVVAEPVTPWARLAVLFGALIAAGLLASVLPGRIGSRMRPIDSLRSE